jgi:hypothetical protein
VSTTRNFFDPLDKPEPDPASVGDGGTGREVAIRTEVQAGPILSQYAVQRSPKGPKLPDRITIPVPRPLMRGLYDLKQRHGTTYIEEVTEAIARHLESKDIQIRDDGQ